MNEDSIKQALRELIAHLNAGELDQAKATLEVLDFERLLHPKQRNDKGPMEFLDPAQSFGAKRVHETGDHIHRCLLAIKREDRESALREAAAAAKRWNE